MQVQFGAGLVIGKRTDVANRPNMFFGITENWSLDASQEIVTLLGQYKVAVDAAPGELKLTGKIKFARIQATALGDYFLGTTPSAGATTGFSITGPENRSNIPATTFTVTGGTAFLEDLGVFYHNTGISLIPVAAGPTAGQYIAGAAAVGTYTIAAADQAVAGGLDLFYLQTDTTDYEIDYNQQLMGVGPVVELNAYVPYAVQGVTKRWGMQLYATRLSKFTMDFKNKGYMAPEVDYTAFANAAGQVGRWAFTE